MQICLMIEIALLGLCVVEAGITNIERELLQRPGQPKQDDRSHRECTVHWSEQNAGERPIGRRVCRDRAPAEQALHMCSQL